MRDERMATRTRPLMPRPARRRRRQTSRGVEKYFGDNHVLRGVDLEVRQREAVMIIGRSGSGKTTLLRCLNFLEEPTVGCGRDRRPASSRRIRSTPAARAAPGADPSDAAARRHALPGLQPVPAHDGARRTASRRRCGCCGSRRREAISAAEYYLEVVDLIEKRDEYPARLSGGQKQRVGDRPCAVHGAEGAHVRRADVARSTRS